MLSKTKWIAGSTVLLALLPFRVFACDVCGAFIGVTPYDNQGGFGIYHRYTLYSRISSVAGQPLLPAGAYRLQPSPSTLHTVHDSSALQKGDFESFKTAELRAKWFVHNRVELNVLLPFRMTRSKINGDLEKISGIGDPMLWVGIHVIRKTETTVRHRLIVGAGVKFAAGSDDEADEDGTRYHLYLQPGTGSFDKTAYLQYSIGWRKWGALMNATLKLAGENKQEERMKPAYTSNVNLFWMIRKDKTVILPQLQGYAEHTAGFTVAGADAPESEMGFVAVGAGCDFYFSSLGVHISTQLPVAQVEMQNIPGASFRGMIGLSWNINQQKFILN